MDKTFTAFITNTNAPTEILGRTPLEILFGKFDFYLNDVFCNYTVNIPLNMPHLMPEDILNIIQVLKNNDINAFSFFELKIFKDDNTEFVNYDDVKQLFKASDFSNILFVCNTVENEIKAHNILLKQIIEKHIKNGVYIYNSESTYIDFDVKIESGAKIYQNNHITGNTIIKSRSILMPGNNINSSTIENGAKITASTLDKAVVGENSSIGPNAYLRPQSIIGENCKIGDFVEIKKATIGDGTKISHLSYVGDAEVGKNVNIGCGVVFVNYSGKEKNKTVVGDNSFIGCNCNLVAPVKIGNSVYIAAGTTVTEDISDGDFCIGRSKQTIKPNRAKLYLKS